MLTLEGIRRRAEQRFPAFLLFKLKGEVFLKAPEEPFFPWEIPAGKEYRSFSSAAISAVQKSLPELRRRSKEESGTGYSLVFEIQDTRKLGAQTCLKKIVFETEGDYLSFLKRTRQVSRFLENARRVYQRFPGSEAWLESAIGRLQNPENPEDYWEKVCLCAEWFLANPKSGLYIREIPLEVDTKFIETHKGDIISLVRFLRQSENSGAMEFEEELGLRRDEPFVRFRMGDRDQGLPLSVFSGEETPGLPVPEITEVFIIENKMVYLSFPTSGKRLCVFGSGFQVTALSRCAWLSSLPVFYFGDLDEHGFLILSQFRRNFNHVRSFCMDEATLRRFDDFRGPGKTIPDETVKEKVLPFLTEEEGRVFSRLREDPSRNRLEQERITQTYIARRLEELCT